MRSAQAIEDAALKENVLRLARDHRASCSGADCVISLVRLALLLDRAGIDLTEEERLELL